MFYLNGRGSSFHGDNIGFHSDIDECAGQTYPCPQNAACADTDGGFTCTCNDGYIEDLMGCFSKYEP